MNERITTYREYWSYHVEQHRRPLDSRGGGLAMKLFEKRRMRLLSLITVILIGLSAQGCSFAIEGMDIEPTDLSAIKVGATREQVESVLGKPIASEPTESGKIVTYLYDQGAAGKEFDAEDLNEYLKMYGPFWEPILTPIALIARHERIKEQRGHLKVIYGMDDTVVYYGTGLTKQQAEKALQEFLKAKQEFLKAEQGDAEAQYHVSRRYGAKSWKWLCLVANQGHNRAQYSMGDYYLWGQNWPIIVVMTDGGAYDFGAVEADYVHVYMWYSLAASNGYDPAESKRDLLAEKMTPEQAAEAERLVQEWKPGSCELERGAAAPAG